jgi:hypothetical protein
MSFAWLLLRRPKGSEELELQSQKNGQRRTFYFTFLESLPFCLSMSR